MARVTLVGCAAILLAAGHPEGSSCTLPKLGLPTLALVTSDDDVSHERLASILVQQNSECLAAHSRAISVEEQLKWLQDEVGRRPSLVAAVATAHFGDVVEASREGRLLPASLVIAVHRSRARQEGARRFLTKKVPVPPAALVRGGGGDDSSVAAWGGMTGVGLGDAQSMPVRVVRVDYCALVCAELAAAKSRGCSGGVKTHSLAGVWVALGFIDAATAGRGTVGDNCGGNETQPPFSVDEECDLATGRSRNPSPWLMHPYRPKGLPPRDLAGASAEAAVAMAFSPMLPRELVWRAVLTEDQGGLKPEAARAFLARRLQDAVIARGYPGTALKVMADDAVRLSDCLER